MENVEVTSTALAERAFGDAGLQKVDDETKQRYLALMDRLAGVSAGFEEMQNDWRPAMVKVTQAMTSAASGKPESARLGDLFYKGGLLKRPWHVAVVYAWPSRVRFAPEDEGAPSCSSENVDLRGRGPNDKSVSIYGDKCAQCPYDAQPFKYGKPTTCNNVMNVLMVPENLEDIFVMPFAKTAWAPGKQLVDLATARRPPWSRFFSIDTDLVKRKGGGGQYAVPKCTPIDPEEHAVPEHLQQFCEMMSGYFKDYRKERKNMVLRKAADMNAKLDMDNMGSASGGGKAGSDFSDNM